MGHGECQAIYGIFVKVEAYVLLCHMLYRCVEKYHCKFFLRGERFSAVRWSVMELISYSLP